MTTIFIVRSHNHSRSGKPRIQIQAIRHGKIISRKQQVAEPTPEQVAEFANAAQLLIVNSNVCSLPDFLL